MVAFTPLPKSIYNSFGIFSVTKQLIRPIMHPVTPTIPAVTGADINIAAVPSAADIAVRISPLVISPSAQTIIVCNIPIPALN